MAQKAKKDGRTNIHFRQTPKEFRAQKQNQVYSVMNRNLPYRVYNFSKSLFDDQLLKMKIKVSKFSAKLPKNTKKPVSSRKINSESAE